MKIFFDLDGTLLDSRERLYLLFQHLVPGSRFSFDGYWELKRNKINHAEILQRYFSYSWEQIDHFEKTWLAKIEEPEWLAMDIPFDGVSSFLQSLEKEHDLYLVTARQFETRVREQISLYGWDPVFKKIFVTGPGREKYDVLAPFTGSSSDWMVGDTGKDIQAGKKLGIRTAAVASGFLSREKLLEYQPDVIAENVLALKFI